MALSRSQLDSFHERGYLVVRQLIDAPTLCRLRDEVDALHERMARETPADVHVSWEENIEPGRALRIRQLMNSERVCPTIDAILQSDAMLDIIAQLIGPDLVLYHSKLMMKAAHDGSFTPWHQDWGYWQYASIEPSQVNCMLSIDAADLANGCIRFVEGSHRQGAVEHGRNQSKSFNIGLDGDLDAYDATPVETEPGDAVFFGCLVIHGSGPNTSDRDRRANTFAFDRPNNLKTPGSQRLLRGQA